MESDTRLVKLVHGGDDRAFEELARRYYAELVIYAARLLRADHRAEDACQQALLQAWIALSGGTDVDEVRAWLYRIVHNSVVTMLRRSRLDCAPLNDAIDTATPEADTESRLILSEILTRLAKMPEPQRQALTMTAIRGDSHDEAASALGVSGGAVRGLVYRARASLRQAAAALLPVGMCHSATSWAGRHVPLAADAGEAAGAAGSAGIAAGVLKGAALLAAAGALAGAGQLVAPTAHHRHRVHRHALAAQTRSPGNRRPAPEAVPGFTGSAGARSVGGVSALTGRRSSGPAGAEQRDHRAGATEPVAQGALIGSRPSARRSDGAGGERSARGGDASGSPDGVGGGGPSRTSGSSGGDGGGSGSGGSGGTTTTGSDGGGTGTSGSGSGDTASTSDGGGTSGSTSDSGGTSGSTSDGGGTSGSTSDGGGTPGSTTVTQQTAS